MKSLREVMATYINDYGVNYAKYGGQSAPYDGQRRWFSTYISIFQ